MNRNIIDVHAHVYPAKIAEKASHNIGKFYDFQMKYGGTPDILLEAGRRSGITRFLIHSVATSPQQVSNINDFIIAETEAHPDNFIGFASLHPDMDNPDAELDRALSAGLKGVKLHPDFQQFRIDSQEGIRLFRACAEFGCPVLIHSGDRRHNFSRPWMIPPMLKACRGKLKLICAHFGGWSEWDLAREYLADEDIWVDTSSSMFGITQQRARELISLYGEDRVLFGSDYPMWDPGEEAETIRALNLTPEQEEKIFHLNLEKLLGI